VRPDGVGNHTEITRRIMSDLRRENSTLVVHRLRENACCDRPDLRLSRGLADARDSAMDTKQLINVRLTRQFGVPPQRIFDAWTDSKTAGKWLFAAGQSSCVEIDARAGGWFYIAGRRNGQKVEYVGEYLELVRPHRLVFALLAEKYSLNFERVTVELNARGTGCELSLTHATKAEFMQQARRDWANVLERLAAALSQTGRNAA
jgi:uncharacterized protein YndB with AHSA1/START domain